MCFLTHLHEGSFKIKGSDIDESWWVILYMHLKNVLYGRFQTDATEDKI